MNALPLDPLEREMREREGKRIPAAKTPYLYTRKRAPVAPPPQSTNQSTASGGRPPAARELVTKDRVRIMARTGMLPLDFLTACFRNELYAEYDQLVAEDGRTLYFTPKPGAERIEVPLQMRLNAAVSTAPYLHKRMPVGVEIGSKNSVGLTADRLRKLSTGELSEMLRLMDKIGVEVDLAAAVGQTVDQEGRLLEASLEEAST